MESQDSGLKWIADHDTKHGDLFHAMFDSPEIQAMRISEIDQRSVKAENLAKQASSDAFKALTDADKCEKLMSQSSINMRKMIALDAEMTRKQKTITKLVMFNAACTFLVLIAALAMYVWR